MFFISRIMTPRRIQNPKHISPAEKGKAKVNKYKEFPAEIPQNPKRLTPAEKGKAKVNEYEEFPAEILQKIPQRIEFLNPDHTNSIILEEVLQTSAKFLRDNTTNYPIHIQILLDNLTRAFIKKHRNLYEKSMKALEYHLICNEILLQSIAPYNNPPTAKIINRVRSPTEIYLIQRISPKEMGTARQMVLDLPGEIQNLIFHNPLYTEYFDRWIQRMMIIANGEDIKYKKDFGEKSLRVFEPRCSFPGLIYIPSSTLFIFIILIIFIIILSFS